MIKRIILASLAVLSVSGCASWNYVTRDLGTPPTGVSVDIKQRMVFFNRPDNDVTKPARICAEPSPDSMTSFGATVGATYLKPGGPSAQAGLSTAEAASYVGLRTQSIQLMRDAMYRACEAYASGAISNDEYLLLQRRFQAQVVGLLAIEQLTGTIAAQPVSVYVSSASSTGAGANDEAARLATARKELAEQQVKQAESEKALAEAKETLAPLKASAAKVLAKKPEDQTADDKKVLDDTRAAQDKVDKADAQSKLDKQLATIYADAAGAAEEDFKLAKGRVRTSATASGSVPLQVSQRAPSDVVIDRVATAVEKIVGQMYKIAFVDTDDMCYRKLFLSNAPGEQRSLAGLCAAILAQKSEEKEQSVALAETSRSSHDDDARASSRRSSRGSTTTGGASGTKPGKAGDVTGATQASADAGAKAERDKKIADAMKRQVKALEDFKVVLPVPPASPASAASAGQGK